MSYLELSIGRICMDYERSRIFADPLQDSKICSDLWLPTGYTRADEIDTVEIFAFLH